MLANDATSENWKKKEITSVHHSSVPMYILDDLLDQVVIWDLFDLIVVSSP